MKVATRQIKGFLSAIPQNINAVLLHGNDLGMISEYGANIAGQVAPDIDDVFSVTRLSGEQVSGDPALIGDSAQSVAMTAERRLVWVRGKGTELLSSCKTAFSQSLDSAFIVVEATDTTSRHSLVKLFEHADHAAAVGCYADSAADLGAVLKEITTRDGISIDRDAAALVIQRLGSDRAASRQEMEKLALLAGPGGSLGYDDVAAALGDSGALTTTDIAMAAADGQIDRLQHGLEKAWSESQNVVMVLRGCQGYFRQLLSASRASQAGTPVSQAVKSLRPPVHFRLQDKMAAQLRVWTPDSLFDAVNRLQDAELSVKQGGGNDEIFAGQALLGICLRRQKSGR